jgi:microcystin-dependent protein
MPYLGEIRLFAGNFAPVGWALCEGQTLPISEYEYLFNLIGTTYGGDGEETFNLPDLSGRTPVHVGHGPGLPSTYQLGETFGVERVTLTVGQLPSHTHPVSATTAGGTTGTAPGNVLASPPSIARYIRDTPSQALPGNLVQGTGGSTDHENRMPVTVVNHIISLFGIFPHT